MKKKIKIILLLFTLAGGGIYFAWWKYNSSFEEYFEATYHKRLNQFIGLQRPDEYLEGYLMMPDSAFTDTCKKWLNEWADKINSVNYKWLDRENQNRYEWIASVTKQKSFELDSLKIFRRGFDDLSEIKTRLAVFPYNEGREDGFYKWNEKEKEQLKLIPAYLANCKKMLVEPVKEKAFESYGDWRIHDPEEEKEKLDELLVSFPQIKLPEGWKEAYDAYLGFRTWLLEKYVPTLTDQNTISETEFNKLKQRSFAIFEKEFMTDRKAFIRKYFPKAKI